MATIRLTSKRQATLPKAVCDELGIGPGDEVGLERRTIDGETVWILRPRHPDWSWFAAARPYAIGKEHDWDVIEAAIERGMAERGPLEPIAGEQ